MHTLLLVIGGVQLECKTKTAKSPAVFCLWRTILVLPLCPKFQPLESHREELNRGHIDSRLVSPTALRSTSVPVQVQSLQPAAPAMAPVTDLMQALYPQAVGISYCPRVNLQPDVVGYPIS